MKLNKTTGAVIALSLLAVAVAVYFILKKKGQKDYTKDFLDDTGGGGFTKVPSYDSSGFPLKKGSKGSKVKALQAFLIKQGFDLGKAGADGDFGSKTESAVNKFFGTKSVSAEAWNNRNALSLKKRAKTLNTAKGVFNDDEEAVYKALSGLSSNEMPELEDTFQELYKVNMWAYLGTFLNDEEMLKAKKAYEGR